ncbi:MAG: chromosome partitioning protein ParA, partial [Ketobacteraceae bacterium]|nr:chromosome partitioning protein ParA [Ketobacteraceae bacterium]
MMVDPSVATEAILFFDKKGVSKEMTYSEFEAVLDGVVGMNDLAGEEARGAYVMVNGRLKVVAVVLFRIGFDRQGYADRSWNIPLRHLADSAGRGPDMGAGPIRLACKSQCPVKWQKDQLWDPVMSSSNNTFVKIRDAIANNRLCLPTVATEERGTFAQPTETENRWTLGDEEEESRQRQPMKRPKPKPAAKYAEPPMLQEDPERFNAASYMADFDELDDEFLADIDEDDDDDMGLTESQIAALETAHRKKIASLIRQQRLHVKTLENEYQQKIAKL